MTRLPTTGQDAGDWGHILNEYLLLEHDGTGKHNISQILAIPLQDGKVLRSNASASDGLEWRTMTKGDVGLGNVDNTSDANKPISSAAQDALDQKIGSGGGIITGGLTLQKATDMPELYLQSSFGGGENDSDSTSRLILESYQRAQLNNSSGDYAHYGEVMRIFSKYYNSKQMIAWYGPKTYGVDGLPSSADTAWFWMGAHYGANDGGAPHGHWSIESPDASAQLQTRFEVRIWDPATGQFGMDKTIIKTSDADMIIGCANGSLQLAAEAGIAKNIYFTNDTLGGAPGKRWSLQGDTAAETGSNLGTNFRINRYSDAGTFVDTPLTIRRSTGHVGIGNLTAPAARLDITGGGSYHTVQAAHTAAGASTYAAYSGILSNSVNRYVDFRVAGDLTGRFVITGDGVVEWGTGAGGGRDVKLYRDSASTLKTDGNMIVAGSLTAPGFSPSSFVVKTTDETITNTLTLHADGHLQAAVLANSIYMVEAQIFYSSSATADLKIGLTAPAGTTFDWSTHSLDSTAGSSTAAVKLSAQTIGGTPSYGGAGVGAKVVGFMKGILVVGNTSGTCGVQWAQSVAEATNSTVYANSTLKLTKIA